METSTLLPHTWHDESINLALRTAAGNQDRPGFVWLGGFKSDMVGTKAQAMVHEAQNLGCSSLRFDYSGHGESGGEFVNGTISRWVDESVAVIRAHSSGAQILVGSSMGAWISLRVVQELIARDEQDRLAGLLLIAPAPDFTSRLMEPSFSAEQLQQMKDKGFIEDPSEYSDEPNIITKTLIDDGRDNLVMTGDFSAGVPVRILQGMRDPDVPHTHALHLVEALAQDDVAITLIKDGDHRLSREADIALLRRTMSGMLALV